MRKINITLDSEVINEYQIIYYVRYYDVGAKTEMKVPFGPSELIANKKLFNSFTAEQRERISFMAGYEFAKNQEKQINQFINRKANRLRTLLENKFTQAVTTVSECLDVIDERQKLLNSISDENRSELMAIVHKLHKLKLIR